MGIFFRSKPEMPAAEKALPGRPEPIMVPGRHAVLGTSIGPPYPDGAEVAEFALGCFWGAEKRFWQLPGVITTAAGYEGGFTPNPTYEEVCSGRTGHAETVRIVFDAARIRYQDLLREFFEEHDPTQGFRQGNDLGTQYRSAVFVHSAEQRAAAEATRAAFEEALRTRGYGAVTTEVADAGEFYFAEDYHQQYLEKNPYGYCPDHSTGVSCPIPNRA